MSKIQYSLIAPPPSHSFFAFVHTHTQSLFSGFRKDPAPEEGAVRRDPLLMAPSVIGLSPDKNRRGALKLQDGLAGWMISSPGQKLCKQNQYYIGPPCRVARPANCLSIDSSLPPFWAKQCQETIGTKVPTTLDPHLS